jgi:hypothetical protein
VSATVCFNCETIEYPEGGGHTWVYLNWVLGLRSLGCSVIWLERMPRHGDPGEAIAALEEALRPYGLDDAIALVNRDGSPVTHPAAERHLDLDAAAEADLLINPAYHTNESIVGRFARTALLDTDPGLLQLWMANGWLTPPPHDIYLTIGETVGRPDARFPDGGVEWHYVGTGAFLDAWTPADEPPARPLTTVSTWNWEDGANWIEFEGEVFSNGKRDGFFPYLDLPAQVPERLELALSLGGKAPPAELVERGWEVVDAWDVARTPADYAAYVRTSRGEFSCAKPSCIRFENAWISDRTVCYLASGRPAVVEYTGASEILPDAEGIFRFRTPAEAVTHLETLAADYERQRVLARRLAEECYDSRKNAARALELALTVPSRP